MGDNGLVTAQVGIPMPAYGDFAAFGLAGWSLFFFAAAIGAYCQHLVVFAFELCTPNLHCFERVCALLIGHVLAVQVPATSLARQTLLKTCTDVQSRSDIWAHSRGFTIHHVLQGYLSLRVLRCCETIEIASFDFSAFWSVFFLRVDGL